MTPASEHSTEPDRDPPPDRDRLPDRAPDSVRALAASRADARLERDWARADELRARIEAAGWRVVDREGGWQLVRAAPPDALGGTAPRYGSSTSVPSRLGEPTTARFSVHLLAEDWPDDLARCLSGLRVHAPPETQVVIVANAPSSQQDARLEPGSPDLAPVGRRPLEIVRTSARLGHASARNAGLRRSEGALVVLADTSIELTGDALGPLETVLSDPKVGVAGGFGLGSPDLRHFHEAPGRRVEAIAGYWLAFRRDDYERLGPLDEKFAFYRNLDIWWSLVLRAGVDGGGLSEVSDAARLGPRSAVRIDLPLLRHEHRGWTTADALERDRLSRRNFYRVLDRFRDRTDLLTGPE